MVGAPPTAAKSRGVTMVPPLHFSGPLIFWWNHPWVSYCTDIFNKFTQEPIHCCPSDSAVHRHGRRLRWNPSVQMTRWPRSENVWVSSLVAAWPLAINWSSEIIQKILHTMGLGAYINLYAQYPNTCIQNMQSAEDIHVYIYIYIY